MTVRGNMYREFESLSLRHFKSGVYPQRNYVQRVLETVNVYKYILTGKPINIHNFFEDKPHY